MVLQVQTRQPGIIPSNPLVLHKGFQQPELGHPIKPPNQLPSSPGKQSQRGGPFAKNPISLLVNTGQVLLGCKVVLLLNVEPRDGAAVLPTSRRFQIRI